LTKYFAEKNRFNRNDDTPISTGSEWTRADRPSYICPYCSRTLNRLTDRHGLSPSYYCNFCRIESRPENTDLRSKSSIEPQKGGEDNPLASTKFKERTVGREPVEIKGGLAELQRRGMKITSYSESNTKRRKDND
jgi:hypothetical protein